MSTTVDLGTAIAIAGFVLTLIVIGAGAIVWFIRLEGKVELQKQMIAALAEATGLRIQNQTDTANLQFKAMNDQMTSAIAGLTRFNEASQQQIEDYRTHTDTKIDTLGRELKAELGKISDKLEGKVDKPG